MVAGLGILATFLIALADHDPDRQLVLPKWSMQVVVFTLLSSCLIVFGPAMRPLGQSYLADVFHMTPATGERLSRLLDIASYLFFARGILSSLDLTEAGSLIPATESLRFGVEQVGRFLTVLGLALVGNLLLLPIVGLLFASVTRRARRRAVGSDAPPVSERARKVDRLAMAIVLTAVLFGIGGGLLMIALGISGMKPGASVKVVQRMLGHRPVQITLDQ